MTADDPINLYAAPAAIDGPELMTPVDPEVEAIRRAHLGFEEAFRAIGIMFYVLGGFFAIVGAGSVAAFMIGSAGQALGRNILGLERLPSQYVVHGGPYLLVGGLAVAFGRGLRRHRRWARWTLAALLIPFLGFELYGSVVTVRGEGLLAGLFLLAAFALPSAFILALTVSRKGAMVFSDDYRAIIDRSPGLKYRPSRRTKRVLAAILGLVVVVIAIAVALDYWHG